MPFFFRHNFHENFLNAVDSRDERLAIELLMSQISKLVVNNRADVLYMIKASGIKVSDKANNKEIAKLIKDELGNNTGLRTRIIAAINGLDIPKVNANGYKQLINSSGVISFVNSSLKSFSANKNYDGQMMNFVDSDEKINQINDPNYQTSKQNVEGKRKITIYALGGSIVLGFIIYKVLSYYFSKKITATPNIQTESAQVSEPAKIETV